MVQTEHRLNVTLLFYPPDIAPPDAVLTLKEIHEQVDFQLQVTCEEHVYKACGWQMVEMVTVENGSAIYMYSTNMPPSLMYDVCHKAAIHFHGQFGQLPEYDMVTAEYQIDEINLQPTEGNSNG